MDTFYTVLKAIGLLLVVVMCFNVIIFVHELGHFLAVRWRGLKIDRFQIWFGKPIWKKEINGVQYGLGWIPAGGFVALPQMAPMESIEGGSRDEKPLPPISPLDKIIVAFAGPLFSMLLALLAGVIVWGVGKPKDFIPTQVIGEVLHGEPAEKAGLRTGDKITHIDGEPVHGFAGSLDSITENIILSEGDRIVFTVERAGEAQPLTIVSDFKTPESSIFDTAHELGHLVMHRHAGTKGYRSFEREADSFAAHFLMPRNDVLSRVPRPTTVEVVLQAKQRWRVSAMAMAYQLRTLGRVSEYQYKSICIELGRRGYRSGEPLGVEREASLIWPKVLKQLWQEKITRADIARDLNIPLDELQSLLWSLAAIPEELIGRRDAAKLSLMK